jgi:hypothetical protein
MPPPWHFTTWLELLDHWQTLVAGVLALLAGFGTVAATMIIARRQIKAAHEDADMVIAATRAQTEATFRQTETTVRLEDLRKAGEALAFHAMLVAAMTRVLNEAAGAREAYKSTFNSGGASREALSVRQCITKGAFAELRAVCVRQHSLLTGEFLELEREIDSFSGQWLDSVPHPGVTIRIGKISDLGEQLASIETKAAELRRKAIEAFESEETTHRADN